jgi:ABC-type xylose transport system permease subunit
MNVIQRMQAPTPKFFKVLRNIGLALAAVSGALLAAPVALPAAVVTLAGYLAVAGTVVTAVSQTAVAKEGEEESEYDDDGP